MHFSYNAPILWFCYFSGEKITFGTYREQSRELKRKVGKHGYWETSRQLSACWLLQTCVLFPITPSQLLTDRMYMERTSLVPSP